ncbi:MAG: hydroxymethylglutaryl-CoA reductase [Bacteroidota bacterium]
MPAAQKTVGFSKLSRAEKIELITALTNDPVAAKGLFDSHLHPDRELQDRYEKFSENTLTNFYLPYGIAPNFLVNGRIYHLPMVTEESSVLAAAAHAARFWSERGGFKARVIGKEKKGQVHFLWTGGKDKLEVLFNAQKDLLLDELAPLTSGMHARGGGITSFLLLDKTALLPNYYQLDLSVNTADAMGANFINSVLEQLAEAWTIRVNQAVQEGTLQGKLEVIMSILSNYTPECLVEAEAETPVGELSQLDPGGNGESFARRFLTAVRIAEEDPYRAVTHNKGIFNGIDAVVIATGNDFRAVEACGHAYASRNGRYSSLSSASISDGKFRIGLRIPMAVGTVGGLTRLHPLAAKSLEILGFPNSDELMMLAACAGLANNFSAVRSLITSGIQKGHMKMHLSNILLELGASPEEQAAIASRFAGKTISRSEVAGFLERMRADKK